MSKKKSFLLYEDHGKVFDALSNEDAGKLIKGIFGYVRNGSFSDDFPQMLQLASILIVSDIDENREKYNETIEKRKTAGSEGGKSKANNKAEKAETVENTKNTEKTENADSVNKSSKSSKPKQKLANLANATFAKQNKQTLANVADNVDVDVDVDDICISPSGDIPCARAREIDIFESEPEEVQAVLHDYEKMRKSIKKPLSERAKKILLTKLDSIAGDDTAKKIRVLENAILHNWLSVYDEVNENGIERTVKGNDLRNPRSGTVSTLWGCDVNLPPGVELVPDVISRPLGREQTGT